MGEEQQELQCIVGIFNSLARLTFENGEQFFPNEYIYTGQKLGFDVNQRSRLTVPLIPPTARWILSSSLGPLTQS